MTVPVRPPSHRALLSPFEVTTLKVVTSAPQDAKMAAWTGSVPAVRPTGPLMSPFCSRLPHRGEGRCTSSERLLPVP